MGDARGEGGYWVTRHTYERTQHTAAAAAWCCSACARTLRSRCRAVAMPPPLLLLLPLVRRLGKA